MKNAARARAALLPAILSVSSAAIFIRWADAPPMSTAFWRGAIAGLAFLPIILLPTFRRQLLSLGWKRVGIIAAATTVICLHQICFITSLRYTSIAASTFLTCTQPVFTAFLGSLLLKERVGTRAWLLIACAILGMALITLDRPIPGALFGNLLALAAALLAGLYSLAARRLRQTTPLVPFMTIVHASGTIFLGTLLLIFDQPFTGFAVSSWMGLLALGLLPTAVGHTLLTYSIGFLPAFIVSASLLGEPVGATILGAFVFHEIPGLQTILGAAITIVAILAIIRSGDAKPLPEPLRD